MTTVPTWEPTRISNVFEWLDEVRKRPGMYIRASGNDRDGASLDHLESMLWGYEAAIRAHRIDESTPRFTHSFLWWVRLRRGWSMSAGWAKAVVRSVREGQQPLDLFFELVDEYRQVTPRVLTTVQLKASNKATGKTGTDGIGRARSPPRELQIVQYAPEKLFLLRYCYPSVVHEVVLDDNGKYTTSLAFAKLHARREFGITASQWRPVASASVPSRVTPSGRRASGPSRARRSSRRRGQG
jgi:hypothetical protein